MKGKRQEKILEIIRTNDIETQEELTKKLSEAGFSSTQGTISRDIRELKLTKVTGANGKQKYAPIQTEDIHVSSKYKRVLSEGILHMDNAENILVIKTVQWHVPRRLILFLFMEYLAVLPGTTRLCAW